MAESEKNYCGVERTLIVFKPDAVQRGIVGEILQRFERVGLKIVGVKMTLPSRDHYYAQNVVKFPQRYLAELRQA